MYNPLLLLSIQPTGFPLLYPPLTSPSPPQKPRLQLKLTSLPSVHLPRLRPHRRCRGHHNQRRRLPSPSGTPTALKSGRRVPLALPAHRLHQRLDPARLPAAEGVHSEIPGPAAGGQHHEDPEGAGRDEDCAA